MSAARGARQALSRPGRPQRPRTAEALAAEMRERGLHAHQRPQGGKGRFTRWFLLHPASKTPVCTTESCFRMQFKNVEGATNSAN